MDPEVLKSRIAELLSLVSAPSSSLAAKVSEIYQGTLTVLTAVHGLENHQISFLQDLAKKTEFRGGNAYQIGMLRDALQGTLTNLKAELDKGLTGSLQKRMASEILTDMVQLARVVLDQPGDDAKNVAAVLAAAAFEDTIRRMGVAFAGVMGKDDLSDVIDVLKTKGILMAPQLGIAIGYLNFRNRALHANWNQIDRAAVNSALGFVEGLLQKHFS